MDSIEKKLRHTLKKARAHQEEHILSNSANSAVKQAEYDLAEYLAQRELQKEYYESMGSD